MKFQTGLLGLELCHVFGLQPNSSLGSGTTTTRLQRSDDHQPGSARDLALSLPAPTDWQGVTCQSVGRTGVNGDLVSRFAAKRISPAYATMNVISLGRSFGF